MSNDIVTSNDLEGMARNIKIAFAALHPSGLTVSDLRQRAEEHNFYRGIYQHYMRQQGVS